ncbi:MAG: hypothetical protein ACN4GZ_16805, partial [Acidimicrobiales bacterium]
MNPLPTNRAAWCEVLDLNPGDRVLVVSDQPDPARHRLERMGAIVEVDSGSGVGPWDMVVVDRPDDLGAVIKAWARVRPGGQLALVTDNGRSPLRWLDKRTGTAGGPAVGTLSEITESLAE